MHFDLNFWHYQSKHQQASSPMPFLQKLRYFQSVFILKNCKKYVQLIYFYYFCNSFIDFTLEFLLFIIYILIIFVKKFSSNSQRKRCEFIEIICFFGKINDFTGNKAEKF